MPDWQPNWEDVAFDHGLASEAAATCRAAAGTVDATRSGMAGAAPKATADWTGRLAEDFGDEEPAAGDELERVKDDLARLAEQIERAASEAGAEQRRREGERERWNAEKQQEDERREEDRQRVNRPR